MTEPTIIARTLSLREVSTDRDFLYIKSAPIADIRRRHRYLSPFTHSYPSQDRDKTCTQRHGCKRPSRSLDTETGTFRDFSSPDPPPVAASVPSPVAPPRDPAAGNSTCAAATPAPATPPPASPPSRTFQTCRPAPPPPSSPPAGDCARRQPGPTRFRRPYDAALRGGSP